MIIPSSPVIASYFRFSGIMQLLSDLAVSFFCVNFCSTGRSSALLSVVGSITLSSRLLPNTNPVSCALDDSLINE